MPAFRVEIILIELGGDQLPAAELDERLVRADSER